MSLKSCHKILISCFFFSSRYAIMQYFRHFMHQRKSSMKKFAPSKWKKKSAFSPCKWKKCALFSSCEMPPFFKKVWLGYLNKTKVAHGYIIHFHFLPVFHKYQQCLSWYYKQNLFRIVKPECYFQEHLFSNGFCSEYLENHISFF